MAFYLDHGFGWMGPIRICYPPNCCANTLPTHASTSIRCWTKRLKTKSTTSIFTCANRSTQTIQHQSRRDSSSLLCDSHRYLPSFIWRKAFNQAVFQSRFVPTKHGRCNTDLLLQVPYLNDLLLINWLNLTVHLRSILNNKIVQGNSAKKVPPVVELNKFKLAKNKLY